MRFELSLDCGKSISIIDGGTWNKEIVHVCDIDAKTKGRNIAPKDMDLLCDNFFRRIKGRLNFAKIEKLHKALRERERPSDSDSELADLYDEALQVLDGSKGKEIILHRNDGKMRQIWDINEERQVFYIAGMSGSGKSYFAGELVDVYNKLYPDRQVFLFSNKEEDPAFDDRDIVRVPLDENLYVNQMSVEDLADSLIIYDDIECCKDKLVTEELNRLSDMILQQGRSRHVDMIYIAHLATDYKRTRIILNECHAITVFPQFTTDSSLKYLFKKFGFTGKAVDKVVNLPSRWVTVFKAPLTVLYESGVYLLK
jgi:hypothetical protein